MGNSDSRLFSADDNFGQHLSIDAARKLFSIDELNRIEKAFGGRESLSFNEFIAEILPHPRIPTDIARRIFVRFANGSAKIDRDRLLVGIAILTKASSTVRQAFLHDLIDDGSLDEWIARPPSLTADLMTSTNADTFVQVLSSVTHYEVEVVQLEKIWTSKCDARLCKVTADEFRRLVAPSLPDSLITRVFRSFNESGDGLINLKEWVCAVSASCRGPITERLKFIARLWDDDSDGYLTPANLDDMRADLFQLCVLDDDDNDGDNDGVTVYLPLNNASTSVADFVCWTAANETNNKAVDRLLDCLEQIGHICLGLPPQSIGHERRLIVDYMKHCHVGDLPLWYVVSGDWWRMLIDSTNDIVPPIDNSNLIAKAKNDWQKLPSLTNEGGYLRPALVEQRDYELVTPSLWSALVRWHGAGHLLAIPRHVVRDASGQRPSLELYPPTLIILRHQTPSITSVASLTSAIFDWTKEAVSGSPFFHRLPTCTVTFSRDTTISHLFTSLCTQLTIDVDSARLWLLLDRNEKCAEMLLLSSDEQTLSEFNIKTGSEVRNADLTWPEEVNQLRHRNGAAHLDLRLQCMEKGVAGLNNLGNTCYMNSALQCISNTEPLTRYFIEKRHITDLNKTNSTHGSKGSIAIEYANLIEELWSGNKRLIAPIKLRELINRNVQLFKERAQHDCQEFLAILLDALHEDLNRVRNKPYVNLKDSDGRPDEQVAQEAWDVHMARDQSIVMDLFTGLLKSCVTCRRCSNCSVRFDPFTFLQLPIPLENCLLLQVVVVRRNGAIPKRYGFRISSRTQIGAFKRCIGEKCQLESDRFVLICLNKNGQIMSSVTPKFDDVDSPIKIYPTDALLYAFELPPIDDALLNGINNMTINSKLRQLKPASNATLAVHRKMVNRDFYFIGHGRDQPQVFGVPLVVRITHKQTTGRQLYDDVWQQVNRLVSASSNGAGQTTIVSAMVGANRALDADEDERSGYPFALTTVDSTFEWCSQCKWTRFCRGCRIDEGNDVIVSAEPFNIAIDWRPTALYLRYQHSAELVCVQQGAGVSDNLLQLCEDDESVARTWDAHYLPISLMSCLRDFTTPEQLDDDEMVHCKHCAANTPSSKKFDIWRLPKILIVHLKRFVYIEDDRRWMKSCKVVDFPLDLLDLSEFVVSSRDDNLPLQYDCFAIAIHYGAMGAGHYVTYAKNCNSGKWYLFNDSRCKQLSDASQIDKNGAYMLFYKRIDSGTRL